MDRDPKFTLVSANKSRGSGYWSNDDYDDGLAMPTAKTEGASFARCNRRKIGPASGRSPHECHNGQRIAARVLRILIATQSTTQTKWTPKISVTAAMADRCHAGFRACAPRQRFTKPRLQLFDERDHLLAFVGVGQPAAHGAEIVQHMRRIAGAGDDRGHARIAQQIFQKELRPAASKSARPVGHRLAAHRTE